MIALLFSKQGAILIGVVALVGILTFSHVKAYQAGRSVERQAILSRSVEILRERNATDDEVGSYDDAQLCRALGGSWVQDDRSCQ